MLMMIMIQMQIQSIYRPHIYTVTYFPDFYCHANFFFPPSETNMGRNMEKKLCGKKKNSGELKKKVTSLSSRGCHGNEKKSHNNSCCLLQTFNGFFLSTVQSYVAPCDHEKEKCTSMRLLMNQIAFMPSHIIYKHYYIKQKN